MLNSGVFGVSVTSSSFRKIGVSVTILGALLSTVFFLGGCKESDSDKIADAQECLDRYGREGGDLSVCEAYVSGLTTPAAEGIRCATGFIREGFASAQNFIDAFSEISTVNAGTLANFLDLISFHSAGTTLTGPITTNYNNASKVYGSCAASYAKGATMISTFSFITNMLYKYECDNTQADPFMGNCSMDTTTLGIAIIEGFGDSTSSLNADLGTIVVNTNTVSCFTGATNEKLCEFFSTAINNAGGPGNKALVGKEFLNVLAHPPP